MMKLPSVPKFVRAELGRRGTQAIGDVLKGQKEFWTRKWKEVRA